MPDSKPDPRQKPITHGTHTGYVKHRARGEEACRACKVAHAAYYRRGSLLSASTVVKVHD